VSKTPRNVVAELVQAHGQRLQRFLRRRVQTAADASDLAQEVYLRLLSLSHECNDPIRNAPAYLYTVAARLATTHGRGRRRELEGLQDLLNEVEESFDATVSAVREVEITQRLTEVLKGLPPKRAAVLVMHLRDGMTQEEVARRLKISPRMVRIHLTNGLRTCRERVGDLLGDFFE